MKTAYTQADVADYAREKDIDIEASRAAHEATVRYEELVRECQAAHPELHPAQSEVRVLETPEGAALYALMNPYPNATTKTLRARVVLLEQARQALGEIMPKTAVVAKDSSIVNCALRVLADSVNDKSVRAKIEDYFNG